MSLSNYAENEMLTYFFTTDAMAGARPATWFVELHTGDPGEDGTDNVSGEGRQAVTFGTVANGSTKNDSVPAWVASTGLTITHISIHDAVTLGNSLISGELLIPLTVIASDPIAFSVDKIVAALF